MAARRTKGAPDAPVSEMPAVPAIQQQPEPELGDQLRGLRTAIDTLTPDPTNARRHGDRNMDAVRASLLEFGWRGLVVARKRDRVVVAGNARIAAARSMGWKHAPVLFVNDDVARSMAYAIADNRTAELAEWDPEQLLANLRELEGEDDLLQAVGFSADEINEMAGIGAEAARHADEVPPMPTKAVAKAGEVWILGQHRLRCGDSTDLAQVQALMEGERAHLCATDPPYCIEYTGERPNNSGKDWRGDYREIDIKDPVAFFRSTFTNVLAVLAPRAAIYCWHAAKKAPEIVAVWRELGILDHQQIVWVKPTPVFGRSFWHFRHEPCLMGWRQGDKPNNPTAHDHDSVWECDFKAEAASETSSKPKRRRAKDAQRGDPQEREKHDSVWRADWEGKARVIGNKHPTQKPVELFARPMRAHTNAGDVVFEPFSGSGSQLIAAEMTGRRCRAMELSPAFVDVAVRRWEELTGKKADRRKTT